jgi:hypothetical protein
MNAEHFESPAGRFLRQADRNLSELVVTIEFTMISIIAGLILVILVENATPIIRNLQFEYWPYVLLGLLMIMRSWIDKMGHVLAFIRWPLDLGHNVLYIGQAFLLGFLFHLLNDPQAFFAVSSLYWLWMLAIGVYDRRLLNYHKARASGMAVELYARADRRQQRLVRNALTLVLSMILATVAMLLFPEFFITAHGHLLFVLPFCAFYLYATLGGMRTMEGLEREMLVKTAEEIAAEQAGPSGSSRTQPTQ